MSYYLNSTEPTEEIMSDGYPRLYSKKPEGEWWKYEWPVSEEQARRKKEMDERKRKWSWLFVMIMKILDTILVMHYIHCLSWFVRAITVAKVFLDHERASQAIWYNKPVFKMPILSLIFEKSFFPAIPVIALQTFYLFDGLIPGPMFRDQWMQAKHVHLRERYSPYLTYNPMTLWRFYYFIFNKFF